MQGDKIAGRTHRRHIGKLAATNAGAISNRRAVLKHHIHAEAEMRAMCNRPANPAHANNPQRPAAQRPANQMRWPPAGPFTGAQLAFTLTGAPAQHQHQRHRDIGSGIGQHTGRVRDRYVMRCRGRQIDVIDADTIIGNQATFASRPGSNNLGIDLV